MKKGTRGFKWELKVLKSKESILSLNQDQDQIKFPLSKG